jgi:murein L,D-transpeptidase YcbB/YkuD
LDILLTEAFLRAVYNLYYGKADPERLDPDINFARSYTGEDPVPFFLQHIAQARIDRVFDWASPKNEWFQWLRQGLARYRAHQAAGGWEPIPSGPTLKPRRSDPRVVLVRKRLAVTGDLPASAAGGDDPEHFDDTLQEAVKRFQARHGIEVDGVIGAATLAAMNVPVKDRIDQIRVNLERGRWTLHEVYDQFLVVDIAGFDIYWVKDGKIVWNEQIQVGKEYTKTPVFKGEIRYLDFNPTWTIPPGILRRSVIPGLKKDAGYLDKKGYQLLTLDGKPVDPRTVDWNGLKGFPYIVRQPPGPDNALGQVKFMFPNPHFVFLHDTNHRELFRRSKRTFSSGCIRVRNPFELAEQLLAGQGEWTREKIDAVVTSGRTTRVNLNQPMRIIIAYNTARVPAEGSQVHFRPDIYQRDAKVLAALDGSFRLRERDRNSGR